MSIIETVCEIKDELPEMSVAVHVTMVSPRGNTSGASLVMDEISTRSDALTPTRSMMFSIESLASTLTSDGAVMIGRLVSITEMI